MSDCRSSSAQRFAAQDEVEELRLLLQGAMRDLAAATEARGLADLGRHQAERRLAEANAELGRLRAEVERLAGENAMLRGGHA